MVPDYRHASPPPIPDGHTVPHRWVPPPRPADPVPDTLGRMWAAVIVLVGLTCGAAIVALTALAVQVATR